MYSVSIAALTPINLHPQKSCLVQYVFVMTICVLVHVYVLNRWSQHNASHNTRL